MDDFVTVNGKKFRKGHTTGACAAAASKAAVCMLVTGKPLESIEIDTPSGRCLTLPVSNADIQPFSAKCSVVKDGGDDPDVTTGLHIFSEASWCDGTGVSVSAGEGIGIVTLPGLKTGIGEPAINPVPMQMIRKEVEEVLPAGRGVEVRLSVPGGREVAERTYNPRLGIEGGISILGTSGIVVPMSEEAWKESLGLELSMLAAKGFREAVFVFGNYGADYAVNTLKIDGSRVIRISNFLGFMLTKAEELNFSEILLIGHLGKLVKPAAGIFHTHSRVADARMEILTAYAALEGASKEVAAGIYECRTTEAAANIINNNRLYGVYNRIVKNVSRRCCEYTYGKVKVGTVLFNEDNLLLAMDEAADEMLDRWHEDNGCRGQEIRNRRQTEE
jgi:cobalt-precorrin-5B (C1)-methyltransferase